MSGVIGDLLPVALGVAISPVPVIAVILMLLSPRARVTSVGFLLGWVLGVAAVVTVVALLVDPADSGSAASDPSLLSSLLKLVLGLAAIALGIRQWRHRPAAGQAPVLPGWMSAMDKVTPVRAVGLAALLAGVNPKNLTLCLAGGVTIGGAGLDVDQSAVAILVFVLVASASVALPVVGYLSMSRRLATPLSELRDWLTANNAVVMSLLLLVIGVTIFGKGLAGL